MQVYTPMQEHGSERDGALHGSERDGALHGSERGDALHGSERGVLCMGVRLESW